MMPIIGFGTWKAPTSDVTIEAVKQAICCGHTMIDCAAVYGNEKEVGEGIKSSRADRKDLFIVSKLWNDVRGYDETIKAFEKTCRDLQVDYLDLYLIHWPRPFKYHDDYVEKNRASWRAMEDLVFAGKIRSIGVSNFKIHHLEELMETARIKPSVNQIEFHPSCLQENVRRFCAENEILVQGYSTLANGKVFACQELVQIAEQLHVTPAQLCTRYALQHHVIPLVKSVDPIRIKQNLQLDFVISPEDMRKIDLIKTCGGSYKDSDAITF